MSVGRTGQPCFDLAFNGPTSASFRPLHDGGPLAAALRAALMVRHECSGGAGSSRSIEDGSGGAALGAGKETDGGPSAHGAHGSDGRSNLREVLGLVIKSFR
jgi:hypothetical protein